MFYDELVAIIEAILDGRDYSDLRSGGWQAWSFYAARGEW